MMKQRIALTLASFLINISILCSAEQIPLKVENASPGAPLTIGIPFPQGVLESPDHVRVLDLSGNEIPSQVTEVSSWEPVDYSIKWIWVFFFAGEGENYILEYGKDVRRAPIQGDQIWMKNSQRSRGATEIVTGPLRFKIRKGESGFIDDVQLDLERDGFTEEDIIAENLEGRGSFLDLLDDLGIDSSTAVVSRTVREKGSGPLHTIIRIEGNYLYSREDNNPSPFIIRIHAYAGKSYIRVFHTLTYTGVPDKHIPREGEHANVATGSGKMKDDSSSDDPGWMQPNDQIAGIGLELKYRLSGDLNYKTGYKKGPWWSPKSDHVFETKTNGTNQISILQSGPKPDRIPPVPNSTGEERIDGFFAKITTDQKTEKEFERAEGWTYISDGKWGIGIGIRNFIEEYPKEISIDTDSSLATAYLWSPNTGPMSFARWSNERDQGMIANFAAGITKTSELVFHFHKTGLSTADIRKTMNYILDPPAPHATPETYSKSRVYGNFAPRAENELETYERGLDYRFDWLFFNQNWEPWYGMFDYGDQKNMYYRGEWYRWVNNEPALDHMFWLQFMRTGDRKYYLAAESMSRHTMDVDNVHWPTDPPYFGDTNDAIDYWKVKDQPSKATPYLGVGRRHANQHWNALLSAHVWVPGWVASYYLTGYHRGLDIARLTADSYTRRIWGDHDLRGRRLYLSVWNLVEVWDATKDEKYLADLEDRVNTMIKLQNGPDQYNSLVIDRYGYSQGYASHGLYKYLQLTGSEKVRHALIRHARALRDNPPRNHDYESYFSSIHSLLVGYELCGEKSFLTEAIHRAEKLKTDKLDRSFDELGTQASIAEALEAVSNLPEGSDYTDRPRRWPPNWGIVQGLRVFGWTHIFNVPWLIHSMEEEKKK